MSSDSLARRQMRAYLTLNALDQIDDALEHAGRNGSQSKNIQRQIDQLRDRARKAVRAAYIELEKLTNGGRS